jgi:hypothetical protein
LDQEEGSTEAIRKRTEEFLNKNLNLVTGDRLIKETAAMLELLKLIEAVQVLKLDSVEEAKFY